MSDTNFILTPEQAENLLPPGERIHSFVNPPWGFGEIRDFRKRGLSSLSGVPNEVAVLTPGTTSGPLPGYGFPLFIRRTSGRISQRCCASYPTRALSSLSLEHTRSARTFNRARRKISTYG